MEVDGGSIVYVRVLDPLHKNAKIRPVVIVTSAAELGAGDPHLAVAITGTFSLPLPNDHVELPWHAAPAHRIDQTVCRGVQLAARSDGGGRCQHWWPGAGQQVA
jgi:hypothetical protein